MIASRAVLWSLLAAGGLLLQDPPPAGAARLAGVSEDAWKDAADDTDFAETAGYRELVEALLALQPPDVAARQPVALDHERALAAPDSLRGTFVKVRGHVMGKHPVDLAPPIGAQKKVDRVIVLIDKEHWVACDLIGNPPPYDVKRDVLELSGVFYRTVRFEAGPEKKVQRMPYILARSLELVDTPGSGLIKSLINGPKQLYLGVFLGALGVLVFVLYLRRT